MCVHNTVIEVSGAKPLLPGQKAEFPENNGYPGGRSPWGVKIGIFCLAPWIPCRMGMKLVLHTGPAKTNVEKVIPDSMVEYS